MGANQSIDKTANSTELNNEPSTVPLGPVLARTIGSISLPRPGNSPIAFIERLDEFNLERFSTKAFELFVHSFPNPDEREPVEDIIQRIIRYSKQGPDPDGGDFHAHVFLDVENRIVGYSQGSIMPCGKAGLAYFWQYGAVADDEFLAKAYDVRSASYRKMGVSKLMHAIHDRTLTSRAEKLNIKALGELWESEEKGLGETPQDIKFTHLRLDIHSRSGGRVMLGVDRHSGQLVNLHLQPRLTKESEPIALHLMLRQVGTSTTQSGSEISNELAKAIIVDGFLENFNREGFDESDVNDAKQEILARLDRCDVVKLLPASEVPDVVTLAEGDDLLQKQLLDMYKVQTIADAKSLYLQAMM